MASLTVVARWLPAALHQGGYEEEDVSRSSLLDGDFFRRMIVKLLPPAEIFSEFGDEWEPSELICGVSGGLLEPDVLVLIRTALDAAVTYLHNTRKVGHEEYVEGVAGFLWGWVMVSWAALRGVNEKLDSSMECAEEVREAIRVTLGRLLEDPQATPAVPPGIELPPPADSASEIFFEAPSSESPEDEQGLVDGDKDDIRCNNSTQNRVQIRQAPRAKRGSVVKDAFAASTSADAIRVRAVRRASVQAFCSSRRSSIDSCAPSEISVGPRPPRLPPTGGTRLPRPPGGSQRISNSVSKLRATERSRHSETGGGDAAKVLSVLGSSEPLDHVVEVIDVDDVAGGTDKQCSKGGGARPARPSFMAGKQSASRQQQRHSPSLTDSATSGGRLPIGGKESAPPSKLPKVRGAGRRSAAGQASKDGPHLRAEDRDALMKENASLHEECARLETQLAEATEDIGRRNEELENLKDDVAAIRLQLAEHRNAEVEARASLMAREREAEEATSTCQHAERRAQHLEETLRSLTGGELAEDFAVALAADREELAILRAAAAGSKETDAEAAAERKHTAGRLAETLGERDSLRILLEQEKLNSEAAREKLAKAHQVDAKLEETVRVLAASKDSEAQKDKQIQNLKEIEMELRKHLNAMRDDARRQAEAAAEGSVPIDGGANLGILTENENLKQELQTTAEENKELLEKLRKLEESTVSEDERRAGERKNEELQEERDKLLTEVHRLRCGTRAAQESSEKLSADLEREREISALLRKERESRETELDEMTNDCSKRDEEIRQLTADLGKFKLQVAEQVQLIREKDEAAAKTQESLQAEKKNLAAVIKDRDEVKKTLINTRTALTDSETHHTATKRAKEKVEKEKTQANNQISRLKEELETARRSQKVVVSEEKDSRRLVEARNRIKELEVELLTSEEKISRQEGEHKSLTVNAERLMKELKITREELHKCQAQLENAKKNALESHRRLQRALHNQKVASAAFRIQNADMEGDQKILEKVLDEKRQDANDLTNQIQRLERQRMQLEKKCVEIRSQIRSHGENDEEAYDWCKDQYNNLVQEREALRGKVRQIDLQRLYDCDKIRKLENDYRAHAATIRRLVEENGALLTEVAQQSQGASGDRLVQKPVVEVQESPMVVTDPPAEEQSATAQSIEAVTASPAFSQTAATEPMPQGPQISPQILNVEADALEATDDADEFSTPRPRLEGPDKSETNEALFRSVGTAALTVETRKSQGLATRKGSPHPRLIKGGDDDISDDSDPEKDETGTINVSSESLENGTAENVEDKAVMPKSSNKEVSPAKETKENSQPIQIPTASRNGVQTRQRRQMLQKWGSLVGK